jgi:hypothetical protein
MGKLMRVPTLLMFILLLSSFLDEKKGTGIDMAATFVNWNKATIASLRQLSTSNEQTRVTDYYKNRVAAFYAYIDIKSDNQLNKESIRYKFLKLLKNKLETKDVFIVEATNSGEEVDIRTIVLYPTATDKVDVEIYRYSLQGWRRDTAIKNYQLSVDKSFLSGRVTWAKGFNHDDVTVSHFHDGKVKASEFFLFGTLSNENVKKAVSLR